MPDEPTINWTITCEHATIRLRTYDYPSLQADAYGKPVLIDVYWRKNKELEKVEWRWHDVEENEEVSERSRITGRCLSAFGKTISGQRDCSGHAQEYGWADLKSALRLTEQLDGWLERGEW